MQDEVRTHATVRILVPDHISVLIPQGFLLVVVTSFAQTFRGKEIVKNHLSPIALSLVATP